MTVCFGLCVLCLPEYVFLCQHFCVPPILTNYIQTERGESLEKHESAFQSQRQYLSFTLSIFEHFLTALEPVSATFWYHFEETTETAEVKCGLSCRVEDELRGHYLDFLVFGQSVYNCDDKVFGKSEVCGTNTLRAVHNECQVQRCTLALLKYTKHTHKQNHKGSW